MAYLNSEDARLYARQWYAANKERRQAAARARYHANPRKFNKEAAAWRKANPEKMKMIWRRGTAKHRYGIAPEQYDAMLATRGVCCPVCKAESKPVIDHCHETGFVRGAICGNCNSALGHAKDNPATLRALADYLESALAARLFS